MKISTILMAPIWLALAFIILAIGGAVAYALFHILIFLILLGFVVALFPFGV